MGIARSRGYVAEVRRVSGALEARLADGRSRPSPIRSWWQRDDAPQVEGLELATIGVEFNSAGGVQVDDRYATAAAGVFAAGDVIGPPGLWRCRWSRRGLRSATRSASSSACRSITSGSTYIFSIPEVAWVGLTEEQIEQASITRWADASWYERKGPNPGLSRMVWSS